MAQELKLFRDILDEAGLKQPVDLFLSGDIGLDENSKTPTGFQIQVTNKFVSDLKDTLRNLPGSKNKRQLVNILRALFKNCPTNGYLTSDSGYSDDDGREVRVGRAGDQAWRSIQSYPVNGVIILNGLFAHTMSTQAEMKEFKKLTKDLANLSSSVQIVDTEDSALDLSGLPENEIDIINKCRHIKSPEETKNIVKYYKETRRPEIINDLSAEGFNELDIADELEHEIYRMFTESYSPVRITESILNEANRQQLLQKSRNAQNYKNQSKGKNRYDRRNKSSISATVRDYNMIQMDPLFKRDILEFKIPVMGETDVYVVDVRVDGLLAEVRRQVMENKGKLEFKVVLQSLMKVLNIGNVYIGCNCPDAKYRMAYWQTQDDYKAGYKERRPSDITNPNDTLGAGCKHVLLILANLDWAVKVASVINNYIKYCRENLQRNYADYIFPKIYGMKYDKAVQMSLFDTGLLPDDAETMKAVIDQGFRGKDKEGKFTKGNELRFQKKDLEEPEPAEDNGQLELDLDNQEVVDIVPSEEGPGENQ